MKMRLRTRVTHIAPLVALALFAVGCGSAADDQAVNAASESTSGSDSIAPQTINERVVFGYARWATWYGGSLQRMSSNNETIVLAQVTSTTDPTPEIEAKYPEPTYTESPGDGWPPPGHPKANIKPGPVVDNAPAMTKYTLKILRVIAGDVGARDTSIAVGQVGGVKGGVAYEVEDDPVIEVGTTYLFFVSKEPEFSWYGGAPFGRFKVDESGKLAPVDSVWLYLPAVKELTGLTVDQAASVIAKSVADAPH